MIKAMKWDLFWVCFWAALTLLAIIGVFWNAAQIFLAIICGGITGVFGVEYYHNRKNNIK